MAPAEILHIEVIYCPEPGRVDLRRLELQPGAVVADALRASGMLDAHAEPAGGWRTGIWGRTQDLQVLLRDWDRVELYRGLQVDPKEARRQRYKRHRPAKANKGA